MTRLAGIGAVMAVMAMGAGVMSIRNDAQNGGVPLGPSGPPVAVTSSLGMAAGAYVIPDYKGAVIRGQSYLPPHYAFVAVTVDASARQIAVVRGGPHDLNIGTSFTVADLPRTDLGFVIVPVQLSMGEETRVGMWVVDRDPFLAPIRVSDLPEVMGGER